MGRQYRLLIGAAVVAVLGTPLWFDGGRESERAVARRLESVMVPTAAAAAIVPIATTRAMVAGPDQFEAARLLVAGTMLFGLAAVVRKAM